MHVNGEIEDYEVNIGGPAPFWKNSLNRYDVRGVGRADLLGLIAILNYLLNEGPQTLPRPTDQFRPPPYLDVNGDGAVRVTDLADLIQHLYLRTQGGAEPLADTTAAVDTLLAADSVDWIDFGQSENDPWKRDRGLV
ncbi:MAG: hypothetical protein VB878_19675 [Pirellulaceae bacterium]